MALKFAFLGAWHSHAVMHVRETAARPDEFQLLGMYDPDAEVIARNQARWAEHGLPVPVFPSAEAVMESEAVAVIVEGHAYQNLDYAEVALQAGKHVLLEKPAGVDLAQFARLQDLATQKGLQLHLAYMWRYVENARSSPSASTSSITIGDGSPVRAAIRSRASR